MLVLSSFPKSLSSLLHPNLILLFFLRILVFSSSSFSSHSLSYLYFCDCDLPFLSLLVLSFFPFLSLIFFLNSLFSLFHSVIHLLFLILSFCVLLSHFLTYLILIFFILFYFSFRSFYLKRQSNQNKFLRQCMVE
jgi:hypothetical protein